MKGIYDHPPTNIFSGERLNAFPQLATRQGCLLTPLLFNIILAVLARVIIQEIKSLQIEKEEVILILDKRIIK